MYNKGKIKVQSSAKQTTSPWSKDVLTDPAGQWKFPGQVTKVPTTSGAITMRGVSKPVLGIDNLGNEQMMMPGMDYHFPGNMVTEYPMEQSDDYDEIELDDEEVEEYRRGGFIVEELPKAQKGKEFKKVYTTDPNKVKMYQDSLNVYDTQNRYNAEFVSNYGLPKPTARPDLSFWQIAKDAAAAGTDAKTYTDIYKAINTKAKDGELSTRYHGPYPENYITKNFNQVSQTKPKSLMIYPGHFIPNSVANTSNLIDKIGGDDTKDLTWTTKKLVNKSKDKETIQKYFDETESSAGDILGLNKSKRKTFTRSEIYKQDNVIHPIMKPVSYVKTHVESPRTGGSRGFNRENSDPSNIAYTSQGLINVDLPVYKKPTQPYELVEQKVTPRSVTKPKTTIVASQKTVIPKQEVIATQQSVTQQPVNEDVYTKKRNDSTYNTKDIEKSEPFIVEYTSYWDPALNKHVRTPVVQNVRTRELGGEIYELTDEEVDEYRRGGFIVEELPMAQDGLSTSVNMGIVPDFSNPNFYTHHNIPAPKSNGQSVIKAGTPQAKELKKSLADYREWEEGKQRALQRADVVTDVMQAGKFIPHPLAQLIGNTGTSLGSTIDLYQAGRDAYDGNYGSMALNLGSVGLARVLKNKGYTRDMYNTEPNSLADIIARTGTRHGEYIPLTQLPLPFRGPATKRGIDYNRNLAMSLAGETLYDANQKQYGGSSLPIAQLGYNVSSQDSLRHQAGKTMDFEFTKGSAQGTGLSNYGNPALGNNPTKEQAVDWYMANIAPQLNHFSSAMEKGEAGDFLYNTGKDARIYAYQEYLRKTDPNNATGWQDASGNWKDRKSVPNNFDDIYNKSIGKLSENERRINVNKGRDWYYKNINNPSPGVPNPAYNATWKPRIWEAVNTYQDGGTNVNYNTPEYNQAYQQGQVTRYNPQTDIYQGQDLPAFEISAKDTRVADAVRKGRDEFAQDYIVPAAKAAASFTPLGPVIGLVDAGVAFYQGDNIGGAIGAGMEALPYGLGKLGKLAKPGLVKAGKQLTENTPLKNAYKLNPYAFKPNPEAYYRTLGKEGIDDAFNSGVIRPKQTSNIYSPELGKRVDVNVPEFPEGSYFNKSGLYSNNKIYNPDYIAEVVGKDNLFTYPERIVFNENIRVAPNNIPIEEANFYKKDWLKGYKEVPKPQNNFKSEIDWAKWNKEIPENKALMQEYNAIEQQTKANGSWMKNPDGSAFQGTPEQFVQQNSANFKKAFPEGHNKVYRGGNNENLANREHPIVFTGDKKIAEHYVGSKSPYTGHYETASPDAIGGRTLFDMYHPKNSDNLIINNQGRSWREIPRKHFGENSPVRDLHNSKGDFTSTDDIAKWMVKNDKNSVRLNNIDDSYDAEFVDIINHKPGNYLKSATGNNGMFDMTNPNIYKSITGIGLGTGLAASFKKAYGGEYQELELTDEEIEEYRKGGFIVEELPMAQVGYNTPEYNQAYNKGQVTRYNPQTDIYQAQDLPAFEMTAEDTRIADAVRRGRDEFATDYMVPAIKTAASFTPMGPLIGLTDAAYALSQGDTFGGILGAGMEALPYGIGKGAKALSKFKNIGRTVNTEPNIIRHVLEDPNKKSTLKKIGDKLSDAKIFPSLNIKHLPKDISFENNMYSVVARGPKGERVAYLDLRPEYHTTGYKKPDGTFHAKNDVIDRMMNDSQYHQQWMDRLTTIEEKGDWLKPAMIKVDKNLWGNQMQDVLYQKGIELAKSRGFKGVRSGDTLLSPSKTKKAHERFMGEALGENMTSGVRHQIKGLTGHVNPNVEKEFLDRYAKLNKLQINPGFKKFSDLSNPSQFLYGLAATSPLAGYGALKAIDGINHLANKMQNDKRMTSLPNKQFGGAYDILELSDEEAKELKRRGYILKNV